MVPASSNKAGCAPPNSWKRSPTYEQRYMRLAEARACGEVHLAFLPRGVRSVGEVLHPHYGGKLGHCQGTGDRPARQAFDFKAITGPSGDKPKVLQGYEGFLPRTSAMPSSPLNDADADKPQKMFKPSRPPCADPSS